ncbi:MAG TPA: CocE/NonD family hydrolase [Pseudolabrys sp.]|uniref:CocE/NonD family hydrolase n=1 Tax=Pseudolabrys sp. TaxID=1960880 RepID=UPI002DDD0D09|nr:CocE/NonD family hydrolase [Pseudolabrys sp.]HEV2627164.1 CocE/NonD family hydrolase [Pseudolabrys sp.]
MIDEVVTVAARDGTHIGVRVYRPDNGRSPALFGASPYRFDNNILPASPQFLWRETGPIEFYVAQGYAFVQMDVRGSGRSGGDFVFLGRKDQEDLYDVIEWIGAQGWCTGKVGGIGQSYFCMLQWFMAAQAPPSLACIGAHDGLADAYRAGCYHGGIPCDFFPGYWWYQNRFINRFPAEGPGREQETDLAAMVAAHPTYDEFWRERNALELLDRVTVPVYSSGVWSKHQLHTRGNIDAFAKVKGEKKLRLSAAPNAWAAAAEFSSIDFHQKVLLPFYDHYLKGKETDYVKRPNVEYAVRGAGAMRQSETWPPKGVRYTAWHLTAEQSESVTSLNDGGLTLAPPQGQEATTYNYPVPGWVAGVVGFGPSGPPAFDPARRVLTFTTTPLEHDLEIAGPIKLVLYASSTARDTDFFIKLCDQFPQSAEERGKLLNPAFEVVTRGWLRASHRALDPARSTEMVPYHTHRDPQPLTPGEVYRFEISLEPQAYRFKAGHRIRLEIVNGDSPATEALWSHYYRPDKIGADTIHHDARHLSQLILPVTADR